MNDRLKLITVPQLDEMPRVAWAVGQEVCVPSEIAAALQRGDASQIAELCSPAAAEELLDSVRMRAAFTPSPPASTRLPFSYQFVPIRARTLIGHFLGRMQRRRTGSWAAFPRWPVDMSADFVNDLCGGEPSPFAGGPVPVLLSHDIDTAEGLTNLVPRFLPIEESVGARSSNYVVPCAWPIDHALLEETAARGHELGIHGYDHSNRTPFAEADERRERIEAARPLVERYGMLGYRAPSLLRTRELLDELKGLYRYDSSIPTSGGLFPVPNNGCASARPFRVGGLVEIPLTMPRDGSLRFLGYGPDEIFEIWSRCAQRIAQSGGIVSLLTHCEDRFSGNKAMLSVYRRFLDHLSGDPRFAFSTPAQVLERVSCRAS